MINKHNIIVLTIILLLVLSTTACLRSDTTEADTGSVSQNNSTVHDSGFDSKDEVQTDSIKESLSQNSTVYDSGITSKINVGAVSTKLPEDWDYNETILVDTEKLVASAKKGILNLTLMNKNIDIIVQSIDDSDPDVIRYKGFTDSPDYNVDITLRGDEVYASVTTYDRTYNIFPTDVVAEEKTVHYVSIYDILDSRLELERYLIDPLTFEIINEDSIEHEFSVEAYDPYNKSIFKETYLLQPGENILSPEISEQLGMHRYVYKLDNGEGNIQYATVSRATNVGFSQKIIFTITDDTDNPILIRIIMS